LESKRIHAFAFIFCISYLAPIHKRMPTANDPVTQSFGHKI